MPTNNTRAEFFQEVYEIVKQIPTGKVLTYGGIARLIGKPQCSRMVGQAMFNAPSEWHLPCHRVVNHQGETAPFWLEQKELLEREGVSFKKSGRVDMKKHLWNTDLLLP